MYQVHTCTLQNAKYEIWYAHVVILYEFHTSHFAVYMCAALIHVIV